LKIYRPRQIENSRLCLTHTLLSKRRLIRLVEGGYVSGWTDPRLPTLEAYRRKGYRPSALTDLCERVGITTAENLIEIGLLEHCCRLELDKFSNRGMAVLDPLKIVLENFDDQTFEQLEVPNHPGDKSRGTHSVPFSKVLYIDRSDFRMIDDPDFYGLAPGKEVGLRYAFNITCTNVITDSKGEPIELRAIVDKEKKRKPKGHLHWVANPAPGQTPQVAEVRLYEHLFLSNDPASLDDWLSDLNPNSLLIRKNVLIDPFVAAAQVEDKLQFERVGFFCKDPDSTPSLPVWNRTVTLKDSFNKRK